MAVRYKIKVMKKYKKDGEEKTAYVDIGVVMDGKNGGFILKLESVPVGWDGWAYLAEPEARPRGGAPQQRRAGPPPAQGGGADELDDDIPF